MDGEAKCECYEGFVGKQCGEGKAYNKDFDLKIYFTLSLEICIQYYKLGNHNMSS